MPGFELPFATVRRFRWTALYQGPRRPAVRWRGGRSPASGGNYVVDEDVTAAGRDEGERMTSRLLRPPALREFVANLFVRARRRAPARRSAAEPPTTDRTRANFVLAMCFCTYTPCDASLESAADDDDGFGPLAIRYGWLREWYPNIPPVGDHVRQPGHALSADLRGCHSIWLVKRYNSARAGGWGCLPVRCVVFWS